MTQQRPLTLHELESFLLGEESCLPIEESNRHSEVALAVRSSCHPINGNYVFAFRVHCGAHNQWTRNVQFTKLKNA